MASNPFAEHLRSEYAGLDLHQVLNRPPDVLLGVSTAAATALGDIGIGSVFDLGTSWIFANARSVTDAGAPGTPSGRFGIAPLTLLNSGTPSTPTDELGNLPIAHLRGLTDAQATALTSALDVGTIRDLALWPPHVAAHAIVGVMAGTSVDPDTAQGEELRPRLGEFPTERVYYDRLVMLDLNGSGASTPLTAPISLDPAVTSPAGFQQVAVGALVTLAQSWYARGVTLGHMLHSLALAPGEATRVAVIDWSRRTSATATEDITEAERLDNSTQHARAVSEVQNAVASEMQRGESMSSGWASTHSEATAESGSSGLITSVLGSSGSSSYTTQDATTRSVARSASWSVGSRSIAASMTQHVNDRTEQHANSVRNRRATSVREVSQSEHEQVSTRVVANYNHMHALTVQYYEVVQIYQVTSAVHTVERCLFVPFDLISFDGPQAMDVVERFRGALAGGALTSRIRDLLVDDTTMVAIQPSVPIRIPRPDIIGNLPTTAVVAMRRASDAGVAISASATAAAAATPAAAIPDVSPVAVWDPDQIQQVSRIVGRVIFRPGSNAVHLPDDTELLGLSFEDVRVATVQLDRPGAAAASNTITVPENTAYVDMPAGVRVADLNAISLAKRDSPAASGSLTLHCAYQGRAFRTPSIPIQLAQGTAMHRVVTMRADTADRRQELLAHLQANRAHYSQVIFRSLDAATLVMLLSSFTWNGAPLADQVEPHPIAVAGNFLVLRAPVDGTESAGITDGSNQMTWSEVLTSRQLDATSKDERLVPIPTDGVFAEAVLGRSNSAEKLDITRFWNWQDSPIPLQPPEIAAVGTGSRATPEDLTPGQLSAPLLNIVNPTQLPDPAGLVASLNALTTANLFRDMSGLQGTQALAQAAQEQATSAAGQAGQLASTNLQTEAQKAVAMGQIAADIAKTAMGVPDKDKTKAEGISNEGARINHGRDMDNRGVGTKAGTPSGGGAPQGGGSSAPGGGSPSTGGSNGPGGGGNGSSGDGGGGGFSREGAYADRGALGFSPDAADVMLANLPDAGVPIPAGVPDLITLDVALDDVQRTVLPFKDSQPAKFSFTISTHDGLPVDKTEITVRNDSRVLFTQTSTSAFTDLGAHEWAWDGFDQNQVFDSTDLVGRKLEISVTVTKGQDTRTTTLPLGASRSHAAWTSSRVDMTAQKVLTTVRVDCQNEDDLPTSQYTRLRDLVLQGIDKYWSRTINVTGTSLAVATSTVDVDASSIDLDLYIETDSDYRRSHNSGIIDASIFYQKGFYGANVAAADADFMETAAHEFGHSVLEAWGGRSLSWSHKGTVNDSLLKFWNFQDPSPAATPYPTSGEIDLMKYYTNAMPAGGAARVIAAEEDVIRLISLSSVHLGGSGQTISVAGSVA